MEDECSPRADCREKPAVCTKIPLGLVRPCFFVLGILLSLHSKPCLKRKVNCNPPLDFFNSLKFVIVLALGSLQEDDF